MCGLGLGSCAFWTTGQSTDNEDGAFFFFAIDALVKRERGRTNNGKNKGVCVCLVAIGGPCLFRPELCP